MLSRTLAAVGMHAAALGCGWPVNRRRDDDFCRFFTALTHSQRSCETLIPAGRPWLLLWAGTRATRPGRVGRGRRGERRAFYNQSHRTHPQTKVWGRQICKYCTRDSAQLDAAERAAASAVADALERLAAEEGVEQCREADDVFDRPARKETFMAPRWDGGGVWFT